VGGKPKESIPGAAVLVTGAAGHLGRQLAPLLKDFLLVAVDLVCPVLDHPWTQFCSADLSQPDSTELLAHLIRQNNIQVVIHLAFVLDPVRTGAIDEQRQWEINVQGTRHVLEAIERVPRQLFVPEAFADQQPKRLGHLVEQHQRRQGGEREPERSHELTEDVSIENPQTASPTAV